MLEPEAQNTHGTIGHNQPPSPIDTARMEQIEGQGPFLERRDEIVAAVNRKDVVDTIAAGEAGDLLKVVRLFIEKLEGDRKRRASPYRGAIEAINVEHDRFLGDLFDARDALIERLDEWRKAEKDRAQKQQEAQRDVMGDIAGGPKSTSPGPTPPLKPEKRIVARGDYGAKVVTQTKVEYTVTDVTLVPEHILNSQTVHDAIIKVVKSGAKHFPNVPGITTKTSEGTQVR